MFAAFIPRFKANSNSLNRKIKFNKFFKIKYSKFKYNEISSYKI